MIWGDVGLGESTKECAKFGMNYDASEGDLGLTETEEIDIPIQTLEKGHVFVNNCFRVAILPKRKGPFPVECGYCARQLTPCCYYIQQICPSWTSENSPVM